MRVAALTPPRSSPPPAPRPPPRKSTHANQRNYVTARPIFERALSIRAEKLGEGHEDTALTLAALRQMEEGQYDKVGDGLVLPAHTDNSFRGRSLVAVPPRLFCDSPIR